MKKWFAVTALLRWMPTSLFVLGLLSSVVQGQQVQPKHDQVLQTTTAQDVAAEAHFSDFHQFSIVAAANIVDLPRVRQRFEKHPLGRMLKSESLELFRLELADAGIDSWQTRLLNDRQLSLAITELVQRDLYTIVTRRTNQRLDLTLVLDTALDIQSVRQEIGQIVNSFLEEGLEVDAEITNKTWESISLRSQREHISLGWTTGTPTRVCVSDNSLLMEEFLNNSNASLHSIIASVFKLNLGENLKPGSIHWFWNPAKHNDQGFGRPSVALSEKEAMKQLSAPTELSENWESIKSLEGDFELRSDSETITGNLTIKMRAGRNEGVFHLLGEPHDSVTSNFSAAQNLTFWARVNWNRKQLLDYLRAKYDRVTETPDAFKQTLEAVKDDLGVDLERELFSNLSSVAQVAGLSLETHSMLSTVFVFDIDRPQLNSDGIAKILHRLFAEDPESQSQLLEGYTHPLWRIKLDFDTKQMETLEAGAMVVGNQFWCSSHADALVRLLNKKVENATIDSSGAQQVDELRFKHALQDTQCNQSDSSAEGLDSRSAVMLGYMDVGSLLGPVYALLKAGGIDAVEGDSGLASQCIVELLSLDSRTRTVDFSKLPDYGQLEPGLGKIMLLLEPIADGWLLKFEHHGLAQDENAKGSITQ